MFTLKIGDVSYGVRFQYRPVNLLGEGKGGPEHFAEIDKELAELDGSDSIRTVCQILELNDEDRTSELISEGSATCTLADRFIKSEGRERAFKKALDFDYSNPSSQFSKSERKLFWQAYFSNHKNKRHLVEAKSLVPAACELCPNAPTA